MNKSRSPKKNCNRRILPRVGNESQAEIPPLIEKRLYLDSTIDGSVFSDAELEPAETWTDVEKDSFVLGLYLFGKNLDLVKKLVGGDKGMGDLLQFYYGKFYNSIAYLRYKCLESTGEERLFTGLRHEKLLARLYPLVSKDLQDMLIENSENFSNQKLSFEAYVFTLKDIVGIDTLVKAVGIGRRKLRKSTSSSVPMPVIDPFGTPSAKRPSSVTSTQNYSETKVDYSFETNYDDDDSEAANENESRDGNIDNGNIQPSETEAKVLNCLENNGVAAEESRPKKVFLFDLNLPYVPSDSEDDGDDLQESQEVTKTEEPVLASEEKMRPVKTIKLIMVRDKV